MNIARYLLILIGVFFSFNLHADIRISLGAKLVSPACTVTSENGESELSINFHEVNLDKLSEAKKSFGILIKNCDLRKSIRMYISPKRNEIITVNNEDVLETSTPGLGVRLSEDNKSYASKFNSWLNITPSVNGDTGKIIIQSQLVTNKNAEDLIAGPFSAALSIMIDYF